MAVVQPSAASPGSSASNPSVVVGNVASGAADSGNPVKVGGRYNALPPTLADGQRGDLQINARGFLQVAGGSLLNDGAVAAATSFVDTLGATRTLASLGYGYNGSANDRLRTPSVFKTVTATANGATTIWTPAAGKKFRLMGYVVYLTADCVAAAGADLEVTLLDSASAIGLGFSAFVPGAAGTTFVADASSGTIQLGNGYLSASANNPLKVNLSFALTGGEIRVTCWGTEE